MKKDKEKHIHLVFRTQFKKSKTIIYRCGKPNCSWFIYEPLIIGKYSECWRCRETMIITKKSSRNKKMHCEDCTRGRVKTEKQQELIQDTDNLIDNMVEDLISDFLE